MTKAYEDKADVIQAIIESYPHYSANKIIQSLKSTPKAISRQVGLKLIKHTREAILLKKDMDKCGYHKKTSERIYQGSLKRAQLEAKRNKTPEEKTHLKKTKTIEENRDQHFPDPENLSENRGGS